MDSSQRGSEGELNDLERRIAGWRPAPGGLDRDRLMFEAGRASASVRGLRWERTGSLMLACLALGLGVLLVHERSLRRQASERDQTGVMARVQETSPDALPPATAAPDPDSYLALTRRMLASAPEPALPGAPGERPAPPAGDSEPPLSPLRARALGGALDL